MDNQLLWYLGHAFSGSADVGEVLDTATRIKPADELSWFKQWRKTATRVEGYAREAEKRGHSHSAGSHYLRAGDYYCAALLRYCQRTDPLLRESSLAALRCHERALKLLGYDSASVAIPYDRTKLHGRIYFSPRAPATAPVLIFHQGLHAWPEETMWLINGAMARGYHVLAFHGPGQGASLRLRHLTFRHDWEKPVKAVFDFADSVARFDMKRATLIGFSFGGALATRAAAFVHRAKALVVNPGVLNWGAAMYAHFDRFPGFLSLLRERPEAFDTAVHGVTAVWDDAKWWFEDAAWKHGARRPQDLMRELARFDNRKHARKIRCRTLVMEGSAEDATPGQARALYEELTCPKTWIEFDASTAAQTHCQGGASALAEARLYDWLDEEVR